MISFYYDISFWCDLKLQICRVALRTCFCKWEREHTQKRKRRIIPPLAPSSRNFTLLIFITLVILFQIGLGVYTDIIVRHWLLLWFWNFFFAFKWHKKLKLSIIYWYTLKVFSWDKLNDCNKLKMSIQESIINSLNLGNVFFFHHIHLFVMYKIK